MIGADIRVDDKIGLDLPGKSGGTFCRLVHLSHLGFECDG